MNKISTLLSEHRSIKSEMLKCLKDKNFPIRDRLKLLEIVGDRHSYLYRGNPKQDYHSQLLSNQLNAIIKDGAGGRRGNFTWETLVEWLPYCKPIDDELVLERYPHIRGVLTDDLDQDTIDSLYQDMEEAILQDGFYSFAWDW